jgi:type IV secretory pathway TraG/TraD family ATPase VirD4
LKNLIATWLRLAIFETMSLGEGDHRLWFAIDELDALGQVDGLKDALARLRKFGGRCVLGFQSIAQVRGGYGDAEAQTIVENCGNTLILRCSASERGGTADFASRLIGKREVVRRHISHSRPTSLGGSARETRTTSDHHTTEDAVMASEIEQLPDLTGFLKIASQPQWRRVRLNLPT